MLHRHLLLAILGLFLLGCETIKERAQVNDIKHAYLIHDEYLLVCLEGVILGEQGEYYMELPLNGTLLHPNHEIERFDPLGTYDHGVFIPRFDVPKSLVRKGCMAAELAPDRKTVPVIKNLLIPEPTVVGGQGGYYSDADRAQNRKNKKAAARAYIDALTATDKDVGTLYLARRSEEGQPLPIVIYVADRALYGTHNRVGFSPPSRDVRTIYPDTVVAVVLFPIAAGVATAITVPNAIASRSPRDQGKTPTGQSQQELEISASLRTGHPGLYSEEAGVLTKAETDALNGQISVANGSQFAATTKVLQSTGQNRYKKLDVTGVSSAWQLSPRLPGAVTKKLAGYFDKNSRFRIVDYPNPDAGVFAVLSQKQITPEAVVLELTVCVFDWKQAGEIRKQDPNATTLMVFSKSGLRVAVARTHIGGVLNLGDYYISEDGYDKVFDPLVEKALSSLLSDRVVMQSDEQIGLPSR